MGDFLNIFRRGRGGGRRWRAWPGWWGRAGCGSRSHPGEDPDFGRSQERTACTS